MSSFPHQMSGGQCQRVMIAMAIACNPKLLIADEPTTALDVTIQKQILDLLVGLQREHGMGLIMITHDMGVVAETAHRVVVQYKGRKMEEAGVLELFENPKNPYTRALLSALPRNATATACPRSPTRSLWRPPDDPRPRSARAEARLSRAAGHLLRAEGRPCGEGRVFHGGEGQDAGDRR